MRSYSMASMTPIVAWSPGPERRDEPSASIGRVPMGLRFASMLMAALRDLQWRRRRFLITAIGTALVFAMSLLLSGLSAAFRAEAKDWIASTGADWLLVDAGQAGPLTGFAPIDASRVIEVGALPGVMKASGFV